MEKEYGSVEETILVKKNVEKEQTIMEIKNANIEETIKDKEYGSVEKTILEKKNVIKEENIMEKKEVDKFDKTELLARQKKDALRYLRSSLRWVANDRERTLAIMAYVVYKAYRRHDIKGEFGWNKWYLDEYLAEENISMEIRQVLDSVGEKALERIKVVMQQYVFKAIKMAALDQISKALGERLVARMPEDVIRLAEQVLDINAGENVVSVYEHQPKFIGYEVNVAPEANYIGYDFVSDRVHDDLLLGMYEEISQDLPSNVCLKENGLQSLLDAEGKIDKFFVSYPRYLDMTESLMDQLDKVEKTGFKYGKRSTPNALVKWTINWLLCQKLTANGKGISVMSAGSLGNFQESDLRKNFIAKGLIEAIIILPKGAYAGVMDACLVVFSHNNKSVRMIDASNYDFDFRLSERENDEAIAAIIKDLQEDNANSELVAVEEIALCDYSLSLKRYVEKDFPQDNVNVIEFGSLVKNVKRGLPVKAAEITEAIDDNNRNAIYYVNVSDIAEGCIAENLTAINSLGHGSDDALESKYILKKNTLLMSRMGRPSYKFAVVEDNRKLVPSNNLIVIELHENLANPYYIKAFFESEQGRAMLERVSSGSVTVMMGTAELKNLKIPVPPMAEQEKIAEGYKTVLAKIQCAKEELKSFESVLKNVIEDCKKGREMVIRDREGRFVPIGTRPYYSFVPEGQKLRIVRKMFNCMSAECMLDFHAGNMFETREEAEQDLEKRDYWDKIVIDYKVAVSDVQNQRRANRRNK